MTQYLVFVYGSLKRGFGNDWLLRQGKAEFMGEAVTEESAFDMYSLGGFPGVVRIATPNGCKIAGELYSVDDATRANLDRLEGHPNHYKREQVLVRTDNQPAYAWIYIHQRPERGSHADSPSGWHVNQRADDGVLEWCKPIAPQEESRENDKELTVQDLFELLAAQIEQGNGSKPLRIYDEKNEELFLIASVQAVTFDEAEGICGENDFDEAVVIQF